MFEDRIIAFVDILGFKNKIENNFSQSNEMEVEKIYRFISFLHEDYDKKINDSSYQATQFSDSLVISYKADEKAAVFKILIDLLYLILEALKYGFLLRGSVTVGKLIHDKNHLFGPAMNKVYKNESKIACFPRIILCEELIKIAYKNPIQPERAQNEKMIIRSLLKRDFDGFYYIDYFIAGAKEIIAENGLETITVFFDKIQEIINNNEDTNDVTIIQKYNWLKCKYNTLLRKFKNDDFIKSENNKLLSKYFINLKEYKMKY